MKKIILLIVFTFLFTACSIEYNMVIEDYLYDEDLYIKENFKDYYETKNWPVAKVLDYHKYLIDVEMDQPYQLEYYKLSQYFDLYNSGAHLFYRNRGFSEFSLPLYKCYDKYVFERNNENNEIILKTEGNFLCSNYLNTTDSIVLNIYSRHNLVETNANNYENGKYTWDITNNEDKNIYLKLNVVEEKVINEIEEPINWNFIGMIVIIIIAFIALVLAIITIIRKRENSI